MKNNQTNETKKIKKGIRFRALDIVIVVLILASVVGVYFRYNIIDKITGSRNIQNYTVSFEIKDIRYTTPEHFEVGDKVYYNDSGVELGTLIKPSENTSEEAKSALHVVPATKTVVIDGKGEAIDISYPPETRSDATGRMQCRGRFSEESGFLVGGTDHIAPGDKISVRTERVTFEIVITDITDVE